MNQIVKWMCTSTCAHLKLVILKNAIKILIKKRNPSVGGGLYFFPRDFEKNIFQMKKRECLSSNAYHSGKCITKKNPGKSGGRGYASESLPTFCLKVLFTVMFLEQHSTETK